MEKEINRRAESLYNIIGKTPGFDIINAVEKLGGRVIMVENTALDFGIDAKIDTSETEEGIDFKIFCVKENIEEYIRFCIAHELGHLFLHMTKKDENGNIELVKDSFYKTNNDFSIYEWEAEEFAACFLMPEDEFKIQIEVQRGDVEKIAKKFKVPTQSVFMRCKRLGIMY